MFRQNNPLAKRLENEEERQTSNSATEMTAGTVIPALAMEGCEGLYFDFLNVPIHVVKAKLKTPKQKRKGPRGGVSEPFPLKLYEMLVGTEQSGETHIVCWRTHGRCFNIECPRSFVREVMPVS